MPAGPVLDVGSGDCTFARSWVQANGCADLTFLDPSARRLAQAQAQFLGQGLTPELASGTLQTCRRDCRFPAVLAAHVVEHFTDPAEALRLLSACLSPAGRLYLVVLRPHWCNWLIWIRFRRRWLGPQTLRRIRIMRALETLATTNAPITQIALSVGYGSLSGFNAAFRAQMGMAPRRNTGQVSRADAGGGGQGRI